MTFSIKGLPNAEATKAKEAFDKISVYSKSVLLEVDQSVETSITMTNGKSSSAFSASYARGVSDTHVFYMRTLFIASFIFFTASFAEEWHASLSPESKAQILMVIQKAGMLMGLASEKGQIMLSLAAQKSRIFASMASTKGTELFNLAQGIVREKLGV